MKVLTLQNRIIILVTIFTVITLVTFVFIQLSHELKIATQYNTYKANLVSLIIEEKIEKILSFNLTPQKKLEVLKKVLDSFKKSNLIRKAYIFNTSGEITHSTEDWLIGGKADYADCEVLNNLKKEKTVQREINIHRETKLCSLYFPIKDPSGINAILRVYFSLGDIWAVIGQVYRPVMTLLIALVLINIFLGVFLSRSVINPIRVFNDAAKEVAKGRLDLRVEIPTGDELEEVADTFNFMTQELIKMKERAENANPLTKLPGNIVIMEGVEKRIKEGKKFTVIYCDLDNFKAFNDKYGIYKGDEGIRLTGHIFQEAVKLKGGPEDFVGHEGGDDFILLTTPERAKDIADYIIEKFDKEVRSLYDKEDLERGYIVAHAHDGSIRHFPIMTISLAGVTNVHRTIASYAEVTNIAAGVKKKAKKEERSCYVVDLRKA